MVRLSQALDQFGQPVRNAFPVIDTVDAMVFAGAGVQSLTAPAGAHFVRIRATNGVYVNAGTAAVPAANISDGSGAEATGGFIPESLYSVAPGSNLSVAASIAATVTFAFYA